MEEYILPKDLKIFYSEDEKYFCHIPSGLIFHANNNDINLFLDACLNKKTVTIQEKEICDNIFQSLKDSIAEYSIHNKTVTDTTFNPSCIVLNISGNCNLLCPYCFARSNNKQFAFNDMDILTCIEAIDYMIKNNSEAEIYTISFFGGEPFLKFQTIKGVIEETLRKYPTKKFNFTATTNGTILTPQILSLLKKHNISLIISIDGPLEITNKLRPHINSRINTFSKIMSNVKILKENSINFDFRATVVAGNSELLNIAKFFEEQKTPYHLAFCFETQNKENPYAAWHTDSLNILSKDFDDLFRFYYSLMDNKQFIWGFYFLETIRSIALREREDIACGAGINMFSVTDNGKIYSCMNYTPMVNTNIGDIYSGIIQSKNELYKAKSIREITDCNQCNTRYFCVGGCAAERYNVNQSTTKPVKQHCMLQQLLFSKYLSAYEYIKNNYPEVMDGIIEHKQKYEK